MIYDVVIAGGGPAGLAAALTLGRGRKRVLPPLKNFEAYRVNGTPADCVAPG